MGNYTIILYKIIENLDCFPYFSYGTSLFKLYWGKAQCCFPEKSYIVPVKLYLETSHHITFQTYNIFTSYYYQNITSLHVYNSSTGLEVLDNISETVSLKKIYPSNCNFNNLQWNFIKYKLGK